MRDVMLRFECGVEDRVSEPFGPFPFAQLTYDALRVGPDGEIFAVFNPETQEWTLCATAHEGQPEKRPVWWSDVVIYAAEEPHA
jgi:hypothetical protein